MQLIKRIAVALGVALCLSSQAQAAIAFHVASNASSAATDITNGASQNSSDGNGNYLLVVVLAEYSSSGTISDSLGNTWIPLTQYAGLGGYNIRIVYAVTTTKVGAGHTVSTSGSQYVSLIFMSFSGVDQASPLDAVSGLTGSGTNTAQPGSITPATANSLFVAGAGSTSVGTGLTIDSSFVMPPDYDVANAGGQEGAGAYFLPSVGAQNPTWTRTGFFVQTTMAVFKPATGGGATIYCRRALLGVGC